MKKNMVFPLLILPVIWGGYYVASQASLQYVTTFSLGIVIRLVTMILLTIIMLCKKELISLLHIRHIWPRLICIGMLGFLLDTTAFLGLQLAPAGIGTVLLKCDIIFINLISMFIYKQKFGAKNWIATFVMLVGVAMIIGVDVDQLNLFNGGNIFFILSAFFVSINAFVIKSVQLDAVNPAGDHVVAFYNNFITLVLFTIVDCCTGGIRELTLLPGNIPAMSVLLIASVGQTLIYQVYYYNLRNAPVWIVKTCLLLMPMVSALISFVVFGDTMTPLQYVGMGIVLLGALTVLMQQSKDSTKAGNY